MVFVQASFFLPDRADDSLGTVTLLGLTDSGNTDLYLVPFKQRHIVSSRILRGLGPSGGSLPPSCERSAQSLRHPLNA
jgi:hypothetical protein